jgi:hypothetical protein
VIPTNYLALLRQLSRNASGGNTLSLTCPNCGKTFSPDEEAGPGNCPACGTPAGSSTQKPKRKSSKSKKKSRAKEQWPSRIVIGVAAGVALLAVVAIGVIWWTGSGAKTGRDTADANQPAAVTTPYETPGPDEDDTIPISVMPARKPYREFLKTPVYVRVVVQIRADDKVRQSMLDQVGWFLDMMGVTSDPNVTQPVFRVRASKPRMVQVGFATGSQARYVGGNQQSAGIQRICVDVDGFYRLLDARGNDISDHTDKTRKYWIYSYDPVCEVKDWNPKNKPEDHPKELAKAWEKLPGMMRQNLFMSSDDVRNLIARYQVNQPTDPAQK